MKNSSRATRSLLQQAFFPDHRSLGGQVIRGAGYQFLVMIIRTVITLVSMTVLARLLTPQDFGYIAMAAVVTEFAALFSNFGLMNVLIQQRRITRIQVDTVFWATMALDVFLALVVGLFSLVAHWLFAEPQVGALLRVMCIMFVLSALTCVSSIVLARLMRFKTDFWIQVLAAVARTGVAIVFAWRGAGVWSLVAGAIAGAVVQAVLAFACVPYWPRLRFHAAFLVATWRTSGSYFGGGLLYYANMNMDLMLIGRYLGATSLGYYQNARSLTDEIRSRIAMPLQRVLFPAFSAIQHKQGELQHMVMVSSRMLAAIVVPIGFMVAAVAVDLVPLLYGPQWLNMIPVLSMLGFSVALKASTAVAGPIMNAANRVGLAFRYNIVGTVVTFVGIALALRFGIVAVAAVIAVMSLYWLVAFRVALGLVGLHSMDGLRILGAPFAAAALMFAVIHFSHPSLSLLADGHGGRLFLSSAVGGVVYVVGLLLLSPRYIREMKQLATQLRPAAS